MGPALGGFLIAHGGLPAVFLVIVLIFVPVLLALGFSTAFIHYLLDRAAFRFSSPDVRQAARGVLQPGTFRG